LIAEPMTSLIIIHIVYRLELSVNYPRLRLTDAGLWASVAPYCDILIILVVNCVKRKESGGF
jgi:hypothetical protein